MKRAEARLPEKNDSSASIVLVTGSLQAGGAERIMSDMANFWSARGWQVTLATWSSPETDDFYSLNPLVTRVWLHEHTRNQSFFGRIYSHARRIGKLRHLLADTKPDVVLSFIDWSNILTILAASRLGSRTIVSERINPGQYTALSWQWRMARRVLYSRADVVVAQTEAVAFWLRAHCWGVNTCVIPNPLRELPNLANERSPLILTVGRLTRQKGTDILVRAFTEIHRDFADWHLMIVGSGPESMALQSLCNDLGMNDKIEFVELTKEIESLMSLAGLVVQPSRFEGFPNVVLEAMGMGAAVISTDCPSGPSEIIEDCVNGVLVPVDNVSALANAMANLMRRPGTREKLGTNAKSVRQRFGQHRVMRLWEECLLADPAAHRAIKKSVADASVDR